MTEQNGSHLDNLLKDKGPEFQAKVLRFALDSGMKASDPAFRLVQYIGYLAQITESAPKEWQEKFNQLYEELDAWTTKQASLDKTREKNFTKLIQTMEALATNLTTSSSLLKSREEVWTERYKSLEAALALISPWSEAKSGIMTEIDNQNTMLTALVNDLKEQISNSKRRSWQIAGLSIIGSAAASVVALLVVIRFGLFTVGVNMPQNLVDHINDTRIIIQRIDNKLGSK